MSKKAKYIAAILLVLAAFTTGCLPDKDELDAARNRLDTLEQTIENSPLGD